MQKTITSQRVVGRVQSNAKALGGVHARAGASIQALRILPRALTRRSRGHLTVQANELNKW